MTRTFVVGEVADDVREWHRLCKEALDRAIAETKPGVDGRAIFDGDVRDLRGGRRADTAHERAGRAARRRLLPRPRSRRRARGARGAGHGAHSEKKLVPGDCITIEPGLYRQGYGGVRLEDNVLVTETGCRESHEYPYDLAP